MNIAEWIAFGILAGLSVYDLKTKKVSVSAVIFFSVIALAYRLCTNTGGWDLLAGMVPGAGLLVTAFCTKESIGIGDGLVTIVLGIFCGLRVTLAVLGMALVLSAGIAIIMVVLKRAGRKTELPFLPCLCAGYLLYLIW